MIWDHHETFYKTKLFPMQSTRKRRDSNQQYCLHIKRENSLTIFSKKNDSATEHSPPSDFLILNFIEVVLIEYSLIGIVKPKLMFGIIKSISESKTTEKQRLEQVYLKLYKLHCIYASLEMFQWFSTTTAKGQNHSMT